MGKLLLLIEVKYLSGKSSFMNDGPLPNDQLAREWDNLVGLIAESDGMENAIPYLLYVTADFGFPSKDVEEARTEFAMKRLGRRQPDVLWIPWRQLPEILSQSNQEILRDVSMVLIGLGLIPFKGVRVPETIAFSWSFSRTYHWSRVGFTYVGWRFKDKSVQKQADTMEKQTWGEER